MYIYCDCNCVSVLHFTLFIFLDASIFFDRTTHRGFSDLVSATFWHINYLIYCIEIEKQRMYIMYVMYKASYNTNLKIKERRR